MCLPWRRNQCGFANTKKNQWSNPMKAAHGPNFNLPNRPHRKGFKIAHRQDWAIGLEWTQPSIYEINKEPPRMHVFPFESQDLAMKGNMPPL